MLWAKTAMVPSGTQSSPAVCLWGQDAALPQIPGHKAAKAGLSRWHAILADFITEFARFVEIFFN